MGMCRAIVMLFALAIGTLSAPDARAVIRTHHFEQLASEQGLAQNTVNILLQDRSGFVWIGTQGGLHRYDGYGFQIHTHDPARAESLADSFITALAEDDQGRLWVGTNAQNIGRLDPWSGRVERFQLTGAEGSDARRNSITELLFQPDKGLWIGSRWGVERFDPVTHSRREILRVPVNVERDSGINAMRLDAEGNLWIASGHGLFRVAAGTDQAQRMLPELDYVGALLVGRDARLWLGLANGLGELDGEGKLVRHWPPVSSQGPLPVWDMVEDRNGMLWMAARGHGLIGFQPETGAVLEASGVGHERRKVAGIAAHTRHQDDHVRRRRHVADRHGRATVAVEVGEQQRRPSVVDRRSVGEARSSLSVGLGPGFLAQCREALGDPVRECHRALEVVGDALSARARPHRRRGLPQQVRPGSDQQPGPVLEQQ